MNVQENNSTTHSRYAHSKVPIRHMNFKVNPKELNKYILTNNPIGSAVMLAAVVHVPRGEKMVIDCARSWQEKIRDPELKARVSGLIGQEAVHAKIHYDFNEAYKELGLPIDEVVSIGEKIMGGFLPKVLSKKTMLATCAAFEHWTATVSEVALSAPERNLEFFDEPFREMLVWHMLEEIEHKSVAYDLYQEVSGNYLRRVFAGVFAYIWAGVMLSRSARVVRHSPGYLVSEQLQKGYSRKGPFRSKQDRPHILRSLLSFFKPSFHPDQANTDKLLENWEDKLFNKGPLEKYVIKIVNT